MQKKLILSQMLFLGLFLTGCGKDMTPDRGPDGTVSGQVTFGNQPVSEGTVNFYSSTEGYIAHATIGSDGKYQLNPGTPVGEYQVTVTPPEVAPPVVMVEDNPDAVAAAPEAKEYPNIPEKYRKTDTSGLQLTIAEGENTFDIKMAP
ncbi:MAG: carboxypeptidase regulatory-like domain-containing protein [Planctomycetaceae bacterium]|nr:carboxypeptidase regulatory-like domain-containing protein [Planctomycetaceae bacterium]